MLTCLKVLREEFRLRHFGFSGIDPECLHTFIFRPPRIVYLIYRLVLPIYTLIWLARNGDDGTKAGGVPWSAFLTNISFSTLNFHLLLHLVVSLGIHIYYSRQDCSRWISRPDEHDHQRSIHSSKAEHPPESNSSSKICGCSLVMIPHILVILSQNVISVIAPMVSMIFWLVLYPSMQNGIDEYNLQFHIMNSVLVFLENFLTASPVRVLHMIYPIIYGLCYIIYTVIFWSQTGKFVYDIINWNNPGPAVGWVFLIGFVIMPIFHLIFYAIYRLKLFVFCKYYPDAISSLSKTDYAI